MPRYIYDIETNGLLDQLDTVHCIAAINLDTGERLSARPEQCEDLARELLRKRRADRTQHLGLR